MAILITGLIIFFSAHLYSTFRSRETGQDIKDRLGKNTYMGLYSLVSLTGLALIIWGYSKADHTQWLFTGLSGGKYLSLMLMIPAIILIIASEFPMSHIKKAVKHPMLLAVIIWSLAHLIDGANLKQLLLFGSFGLYSIIDIVAVSLRRNSPDTKPVMPSWRNDALIILAASVTYVIFAYWLHNWLFGLDPSLYLN